MKKWVAEAVPLKEVAGIGIHAGAHGFMIENVGQFTVSMVEGIEESEIFKRTVRDLSYH